MIAPLNLEKQVQATENTEATEWVPIFRRSVLLLMGGFGKAVSGNGSSPLTTHVQHGYPKACFAHMP
jgi:hypothetical protein